MDNSSVNSTIPQDTSTQPSPRKPEPVNEVEESNQVAETLISLQNLIERNANELDRMKDAVKELRQQLKNIFENNVQLTEAEQMAEEVTTKVKELRQSVDNQPEVRQIKLKLTDLKEEMKEIEETLNSHLIHLFQLTGSNSFDTSDGDQREFELKARVKSRGHKHKDDAAGGAA